MTYRSFDKSLTHFKMTTYTTNSTGLVVQQQRGADFYNKCALTNIIKLKLEDLNLVLQISKGRLHCLMKLFIVCLDFGLAILDRIFEFHRRQLVKDIAHGFADHVPSNFVLRLRSRLYRMTSQIVKKPQCFGACRPSYRK